MSPQNPIGLASQASKRPSGTQRIAASDHVWLEADILDAEENPAAISTDREVPSPQNGLRVLVVDDNADMRAYVKGCLLQPGIHVTAVLEAADGRAALERARQGGIDLIICDVVMPNMDGVALCRALQAHEDLRDVPVLLITGEGLPPALPVGASGMLAKPFNATKMQAWVRRLLGNASGRSPPSD